MLKFGPHARAMVVFALCFAIGTQAQAGYVKKKLRNTAVMVGVAVAAGAYLASKKPCIPVTETDPDSGRKRIGCKKQAVIEQDGSVEKSSSTYELRKALNEERTSAGGDFVGIPGSGFTAKATTVEQFRKFAPRNTVTPIFLDGEESEFVVLQPRNHSLDDENLEHVFMMFNPYRYLLVTQLVKDQWERLGLAGAVFEYVTRTTHASFLANRGLPSGSCLGDLLAGCFQPPSGVWIADSTVINDRYNGAVGNHPAVGLGIGLDGIRN